MTAQQRICISFGKGNVIYLSIYQPIYPSFYPSIHPSVHLPIYIQLYHSCSSHIRSAASCQQLGGCFLHGNNGDTSNETDACSAVSSSSSQIGNQTLTLWPCRLTIQTAALPRAGRGSESSPDASTSEERYCSLMGDGSVESESPSLCARAPVGMCSSGRLAPSL